MAESRPARRALLASALALGTLGLPGCADRGPRPVAGGLQAEVAEATARSETRLVPGGRALVLHPEDPDGRLVLYVHGAGEDRTALTTDPQKAPTVAGLLRRGYTMVAADAFGDAWGSRESLDAYVDLLADVPHPAGVFVLAQSMGGLDALRLPDVVPGIRAMALTFPVCDLAAMTRGRLADAVDAVWGDAAPQEVAALSPALAEHVAGLPMRFWASPDDTYVEAADHTVPCAALARERGADVEVTETTGEHGDASNFDAAGVIALFDAAG